MDLTSASNRQVTLLRKLNNKKYRNKKQQFFIEGARAVQQVIENDQLSVKCLFFDESQRYWQQDQWKTVTENYETAILEQELFEEVSDTDTPQGVLALCEMPEETTVDKLEPQGGMVLALDAVQDPGNLGTIIRTASWFGAAGLISGKGTVDLFNPKVVRATAGATGSIPHKNGDLSEILDQLEKSGWEVLLLDADSDAQSLSELEAVSKTVIVVGNEAHGIRPSLIAKQRPKVQISPATSNSGVESLNAAVAASITMHTISGRMSS